MELLILNKNFEEIGTIDVFSSLQWHRKYYECGSFELHTTVNNFSLLDEGHYLFRKDAELAIITTVELSLSEDGSQEVVCEGEFIESILGNRMLYQEKTYTNTPEMIARTLVQEHCINPIDGNRKVTNLNLGTILGGGSNISDQVYGEQVDEKIYSLLKESELSQRIRYDYLSNKLYYEVWQGLDRTESQSTNEWASFSNNFENIKNESYSRDNKKYKNFVYIIGKDAENNPVVVEVDKTSGEERRELFLKSSKSMKREDNTVMTLNEYKALLRQEALEKLEDYKVVETFDGEINVSANLVYKKDYNLGDLCTVINTTVGKILEKRIIEITEVYEDGNIEINPVFGDDYITVDKTVNKIKKEVNRI